MSFAARSKRGMETWALLFAVFILAASLWPQQLKAQMPPPFGPGPATHVEVTLGGQTRSAAFPALGLGDTVSFDFDMTSDASWSAAAPGASVALALSAVSTTTLPDRVVSGPGSDPNVGYDLCYARTTTLGGGVVTLVKPDTPTGASGNVEPPVAVPVLGWPGMLLMGGLLLGVAWRGLRSGAAGKVLSALALLVGGAWLMASPHQAAQAQIPSMPCTPAEDALTNLTYSINATTVTVTVTRRFR